MSGGILRRLIERLEMRVGNMMFRALVTATDNSKKMQMLQVAGRTDEIKDAIECFEGFGVSFIPLPPDENGEGAETLVLALDPDHRVALPPTDRRYRPADHKVPGEGMLYTDEDKDGGFRIHFKRGRKLQIICDTAEIKAEKLARLDADVIEFRAGTKLHFDVNGYGEDWIHENGEYRVDTYKIGNVVSGGDYNIAPPEHNK